MTVQHNKRITVFGGSTPQPGDAAYQEAYELGRLIGAAGYTAMTGGYSGTMEAVSRGANEAGGHVIGVTCANLEIWRPLPPNQWIHEEMRYQTLRERMYALMDHTDLAIALPGGIGTLAEISAMWSELQTGEFHHPPLILVGLGWQRVFEAMKENLKPYVGTSHWELMSFASDAQHAFAAAHHYLKNKGG